MNFVELKNVYVTDRLQKTSISHETLLLNVNQIVIIERYAESPVFHIILIGGTFITASVSSYELIKEKLLKK